MREIEIKVKINNIEDIVTLLAEKGCKLSGPSNQRDVIYSKNGSTREWEESKEGDIIMRIRYLDGNAEFNVKQQKSSESDNLEFETKIDDPESLHNIITMLGYLPMVEVKKIRQEGRLGEYEICLDQVEDLGNFLEIEAKVNDNDDPLMVREKLFKILESFRIKREQEEIYGYDTQIYRLKNNTYASSKN